MKMKNYWGPTPKRMRKLGDALLSVSTLLSTYSVADEWGKTVTIAIIVSGVAGKFLTNFFTEDEADNRPE